MTIYAYLLMCFIYGTTFMAIKVGLVAGLPPFWSAGLRFATAGMLIIGYLLLCKRALPARKNACFGLLRVGMCMTFLPFAALYWGEQHISSGTAALLSATGPVHVVVLGLLLERKRPVPSQQWGLAVAILGLFLVVLPNLEWGASAEWFVSAAVILLSEIAYAWGALVSKQLLSDGLSPLSVNGFQMFFGGLGLLLVSLLFEPAPASVAAAQAIGSLMYLIVFGSIVASGIYYWLVNRTNPLFPSTWLYVSPVIALIVGWWALGEPIDPVSVLGTLLVISGVVLINLKDWQEWRRSIKSVPSVR
ncbi:MAG: EamA family transporter [Brevibacillus sp.]|nr:EamA family transporter [Brevibacillus sp.]